MATKRKGDFLGEFIGSPARAQLMRVFLYNPSEPFTLASIAKRAGMSAVAVAREMKLLESMGVVKKGKQLSITLGSNSKRVVKGNQKVNTWAINPAFKHLRALSSFVHEVSPVQYDVIIGALKRSGKVATIILSGSFMGDSTRPADMIIAIDTLNERRLESAVKSLEPAFGREIRYAAFSTPEFRYRLTVQDKLIRDTLDFPHLVLLDRTRLL